MVMISIYGTRFDLHDEWRYDLNKNRRRWSATWGPTPSSRLSAAESNRIRAELFDWPVIGPLMKNHYMMESMDQYLDQHGMTWADVDPLKMNQIFGSNSSTALQLSRNVLRLYR